MKETDYINNLKNTIANLEKEYNDLINKKKLAEERLVEIEKKSREYYSYYDKINQYCKDNDIDLNTIMTNECIEYLKKETDIVKNNFYILKFLEKKYVNKDIYKEVINSYSKSFLYCQSFINLDIDLDKYQTKINSLQKELHYANAILEGVNTLKDIKQLLTKNE